MAGGTNDLGLAFLRLAGLGLAYHGYQKIFEGNMSTFTGMVEKMHFPLPTVFAWAAALSELGGGVLVAIGLFTRPAAVFAAITMFVASFVALDGKPFAEREMSLAYLVVMLCLACLGAGKWSADGLILKKS